MKRLFQRFGIRPNLRTFLTAYYRRIYSTDLTRQLALRALNATCEYIERNMAGAPMFDNKYQILDYMLAAVSVDGSNCEFGVWQGDSVNYIARRIQGDIHAFDSFEGLPEYWKSGYGKGAFGLEQLPEFEKNVIVHKGWFSDTLPEFTRTGKDPIAFLHVDCDLYSSTKTIFDHLGNSIVEGTCIVFDEYFNYPFWQDHEFKAFQEFVQEHGIEYEYLCYGLSKVGVKITKR